MSIFFKYLYFLALNKGIAIVFVFASENLFNAGINLFNAGINLLNAGITYAWNYKKYREIALNARITYDFHKKWYLHEKSPVL